MRGEGHTEKGRGECLIRENRLRRVKCNWIMEWMKVMRETEEVGDPHEPS